jgi:hypothetical protein
MDWIDVKKELPKGDRVDCLVYCPQSFPKNIRMLTATYYEDNRTFYGDASDNPHKDVTHWMPLPKEPNE